MDVTHTDRDVNADIPVRSIPHLSTDSRQLPSKSDRRWRRRYRQGATIPAENVSRALMLIYANNGVQKGLGDAV